MIPAFTSDGLLPPGQHECDLKMIESKLGFSECRKEVIRRLLRLVSLLPGREAIDHIVLNGSFAEAKTNPADADLFIVVTDLVNGGASTEVLRWVDSRYATLKALWRLDVTVGDQELFDESWKGWFGRTRDGRSKGYLSFGLVPGGRV